MKVKIPKLVRRAMLLLDEDCEELKSAVVYGDKGVELRRLARQLVPEAARAAIMEADLALIDETQPIDAEMTYDAQGVGEIKLPDDFLRLVELRMADWAVGLCGYASEMPATRGDMPVLRHHPDSGGAEAATPALLLGHGPDGRVIRVFGTASGTAPAVTRYLPQPEVTDGAISIPKALFEPVARKIADMILSITTE